MPLDVIGAPGVMTKFIVIAALFEVVEVAELSVSMPVVVVPVVPLVPVPVVLDAEAGLIIKVPEQSGFTV